MSEGRVHRKWRLAVAESMKVGIEIIDLLLEGLYASIHGSKFAAAVV